MPNNRVGKTSIEITELLILVNEIILGMMLGFLSFDLISKYVMLVFSNWNQNKDKLLS